MNLNKHILYHTWRTHCPSCILCDLNYTHVVMHILLPLLYQLVLTSVYNLIIVFHFLYVQIVCVCVIVICMCRMMLSFIQELFTNKVFMPAMDFAAKPVSTSLYVNLRWFHHVTLPLWGGGRIYLTFDVGIEITSILLSRLCKCFIILRTQNPIQLFTIKKGLSIYGTCYSQIAILLLSVVVPNRQFRCIHFIGVLKTSFMVVYCISVWVCMSVCVCVCACMCVCVHVCMCECVCVCAWVYVSVCVCVLDRVGESVLMCFQCRTFWTSCYRSCLTRTLWVYYCVHSSLYTTHVLRIGCLVSLLSLYYLIA